jgi:ribokinase
VTEGKANSQIMIAGSANVDFVVRAPNIPAPGETVLGSDLMIVPGGKGANQAVACALAGGVLTSMVAAIGNDSLAGIVANSLSSAGVHLHRVESERSTGVALITVSEQAENAITVAPGANADLSPTDLPDLSDIEWLVVQLETPIETVTAFARAAKIAGVKVLLNAAPAREIPAALLQAADVVVVNEPELSVVAGIDGSIAAQLQRVGVSCAVVTLGGRGCCAFVDGRWVLQPAFTVEPVDTTAAGDTFVGVLAAVLSQNHSIEAALRLAAAAAALTTTRAGAQSSIPKAAEVIAFAADGPCGERQPLMQYCGLSTINA